jgi:hypothetical protein
MNGIFDRPNRFNLLRPEAHDRGHEMVSIFAFLSELTDVIEKIFTLFFLPAVKPLVAGNSKNAITEQSI